MNILELITEGELELVLHALEAQEIKCKTIGNAGITGHGRASEIEKRKEWRFKAEMYRDLQSKIANLAI
jgi:predicted transcriptional regulator YheO